MGAVLLAAREAHIVHRLEQLRGYVAVVLRRRLAADVGTGAYQCLLETVAQLLRERLIRDADAYAAIFGYEVFGQVDGTVQYHGRGLHGSIEQLPCHVGHIPHVALKPCVAVDKADKSLAVVAPLDVVDASDSFAVGRITAQSPHGVGGIEYHASLAQHLHGLAYVFFSVHLLIFRILRLLFRKSANGVFGDTNVLTLEQ